MTHTVNETVVHTIETLPLNRDLRKVFVEIDITGLDAENAETSFAATEYVANPHGIETLGQASEQFIFTYNRATDVLGVWDADTAGVVAAGTPVGIVDLFVVGYGVP